MASPRCLLVLLLVLMPASAAERPSADRLRGGKVEWARLDTGTRYWDRHSESDEALLRLLQEHTALNISSRWLSTKPENLEDVCRYPFIYTDNLAVVKGTAAKNMAEYLRRGGFILIDACVNDRINPSPVKFFEAQVRFLRQHLPEVRIVELPQDHEVFTLYFQMAERPPRAHPNNSGNWVDRYPTFPLRAAYLGDRMVAAISLNGYQCAWSLQGNGTRRTAIECMQMATNLYVYAMTR